MNHDYTPHQLDPDEALRTVPAGWDLSGMAAKGNLTPRLASNLTPQPPSLSGKGEFAQEDGLQPGEWQPEKFDSLRTTPRCWDVSNLR
jgi:hypothetical protein